MTNDASITPARRWGDALRDALPDMLAALACGIAWKAPDALGFDLLGSAGMLYFVELPLALLLGFVGVRRIADPAMTRATKLRFIVVPALMLACFSTLLLGWGGLIAVLWLGGLSLWRLLRDGQDRRPAVAGLWLVFGQISSRLSFELTSTPPDRSQRGSGVWVVPAGHDEMMAGLTVALWVVVAVLLVVGVDVPAAGATPAYAESVSWSKTVIGAIVPAHQALAAGLILFTARTLAHFEGLDEVPPVRIEDDEGLREVIASVEGQKPPKSKRRGR